VEEERQEASDEHEVIVVLAAGIQMLQHLYL
jgi:hypothetical protein